jgi:hypothetical protein
MELPCLQTCPGYQPVAGWVSLWTVRSRKEMERDEKQPALKSPQTALT